MFYNKDNGEAKQRFGIRKLTIGTCSVLLSTLFLTMGNNQTVHASEKPNSEPATEAVASSTASSDASDANTAANEKAEDEKQTAPSSTTNNENNSVTSSDDIETKSVDDSATGESRSDESKAGDVNKAENTTKEETAADALTADDNEADKTTQTTLTNKPADVSTSAVNKDTDQKDSEDSDTATLKTADLGKNATAADPKKLKESKATASNPAPEVIGAFDPSNGTDYGMGFVIAGTNLTPADFLSNAVALKAAGATLSWDGETPTATADQAESSANPTATIKITYKNGKTATVEVGYYVTTPATTQVYANGQSFYYVPEVNGQLSLTDVDANGVSIFNGGNTNNLIPTQDGAGDTLSVTFDGEPDTSTIGLHYANVKVSTDTSDTGITLIGGTYDLKVPYIVKTLPTYSDDPVINAQLYMDATLNLKDKTATDATEANFRFTRYQTGTLGNYNDAFANNSAAFGRLVYQDYLQYYALGGQMTADPIDLGTVTDHADFATTPVKLTLINLNQGKKVDEIPSTTVTVNWVKAPHKSNDDQVIYIFTGTNVNDATSAKKHLNELIFPSGYGTRNTSEVENLTKSKDGLSNYFTPIELANGEGAEPTGIYILDNSVNSGENGKYSFNNVAVYYGQNIDSSTGKITISDATTANPAIASTDSVVGRFSNRKQPGSAYLSQAQRQEILEINPSATNMLWADTINNAGTPTAYYGFTQEIDTIQNPTGFTKNVDISDGSKTFNLSDWTSYSADATDLTDKIVAKVGTANSDTGTTIAWPEGTKFEILNPDNDPDITNDGQSVTMNAPGQTKTLTIKITLPGTEDISETTQVILKTNSGVGYQFVDQVTNKVVGSQVDYWAAAGSSTVTVGENATPKLTLPTGYKLVDGESLPSGEVTVPPNTPKGNLNTIYVVANKITQKYQFVNADEDDAVIGDPITVKGTAGGKIAEGTFTVPAGYQLQSGTELPTTLPTAASDKVIDIPVVAKTEQVTIQYVDPSGKVVKTDATQSGKVGEDLTLKVSGFSVNVETPVDGQSSLPYNIAPAKYQNVTINNGQVTYKVTDADKQTVTIKVYQPHMNIVYWNDTTNKEVTSDYFINSPSYGPSGYDPRIEFPADFNRNDYVCTGVTGAPAGLKILGDNNTPLETYNSIAWSVPNFHVEDGYDADELNYELSLDSTKLVFHLAQKAHQTYQFVDADENNAKVGNSVTVNGIVNEATTNSVDNQTLKLGDQTLQIPDNYEIDPTYTLPTSVDLSADSSTINIPLVHKTITYNPKTDSVPDGVDVSETVQTRTPTLNYVYGTDVKDADGNVIHKKGDQMVGDDGKVIAPAVLDVYYTRTATVDLVTKKITSYGNWQWDSDYNEDGYKNGYKVVSGTWTDLPTEWAPVVADVPTVDGYTAWTKTSETRVSTNKFVFPTYTNSGITDSAGNSIAYTTDADTYEASPVHTVWYIPTEVQARTITEHFKKTDADGNVIGDAASPIQANVYYEHEISDYDSTTGEVTYGNWSWDTDAGDSSTPGIKILSGEGMWKIPTKASEDWGINAPVIDGYTMVNTLDESYGSTTTTLGALQLNADVAFTSASPSLEMRYRNDITTYYVPTSALSKTLTRTINVYLGDSATPTYTQSQTAAFSRDAVVNLDDTGVIFGLNENTEERYEDGEIPVPIAQGKWRTATDSSNLWSSIDMSSESPYSTYVQEGYIPTIDGKVAWSVPSVTVDPNTNTDETVDIVYVKQKANIGLTGTYTDTYTGQAATIPADVINQVTETLVNPVVTTMPDSSNLDLTAADFSFTDENGTIIDAPTNVGTYHIILNGDGLKAFEKFAPTFTWNYDPTTAFATYTINPAQATISIPADDSQTAQWTGSTPTIDPSKFVPTISTTNKNATTIALPSGIQLTASDYEIVDDNGNKISPTEIGSYKVRLTEDGWKKIENAVSGNTNYNWNYTGTGTLNITKADATVSLSGTGSQVYTGSAIVLGSDNLGTIKVTLSNGETYDVTAADLQFVDGAPVNVGNYTGKVELSAQGLANIAKLDPTHYNYTYDDSTANFDVDKAAATYQLSGDESKVYNGQPATLTATGNPGYKVTITTNNGQQLTYALTNDDIEFDTEGNVAPTNHGVYNVKLSQTGIDHLTALNSNYEWTAKDSTATYDIKQAEMTVNLTGAASTVFNNQEQPLTQEQIDKLQLTWAGSTTVPDGLKSVGLTADDIEYLEKIDGTWQVMDHAPMHATDKEKGESPYGIRLTQKGLEKVQNANKDSNYTFVLGDQVQATYVINQLKAQLTLRGYQTAPYTQNKPLDPSNFKVYLTNTANNVEINVSDNQYGDHELVAGDLEIVGYKNSLPTEVGSYKVKVTDQLITALKQIFPDYDFNAYTPGEPSAQSATDGNGVTNDNGNQDVAASNNDGKYIITPIDAMISLTGHQTIKYGESDALKVDSTGRDGYTIKLTDTYGNVIGGFTLTPKDLEFINKNDEIVNPKNVGDYEVTLTDAAMKKIDAIGQNSLGNMNYTWINQFTPATFTVEKMPVTITISDKSSDSHQTITYGEDVTLNPSDYSISLKTLDYTLQAGDLAFADGTPTTAGTFNVILSSQGLKNIEDTFGTKNYTYSQSGNGLFTINAAQPTVVLSGTGTQVYNGQAIPDYKVTATVTGPNTNQTVTLSGDDLEYVNNETHEVSTTAPVNSGTYTVQLTQAGKDKIAKVNSSNLDWTKYDWSTMTGTPTYTISKATATVTVDGTQSTTYTGKSVINWNNFVPTVSTNNGLTLTIPTSDLTAADYVITDKDGNVVTDPTDVGTYTIKLTADGLKKLESQTNNYDWKNAGQGTLTINSVIPKVEINAEALKVYDGTAIANYAPQVTITAPGVGKDNQVTLTTGDFEFKVGDKWTTEAPVNAGDYEVQLTEAGLNKIKAVNSTNLDWSKFTPTVQGDYSISKANAVISLNNSQKQDSNYTGKSTVFKPADFVPTIEDTTHDKPLTAEDLHLTADDYEFKVDGEWTTQAPVNAGTYKVRLNQKGIDKVKAAVAGNSNYNWTYEGTGLEVIIPAVPTITITANTDKSGKVYDGQPGEISSDDYTITITNSDGSEVTTLDGSDLQFTDGKIPTDVGNYQVSLTPEAINQLKNKYPNYNWDKAGKVTGEYDITPFDITITTSGSDEAYQGNVRIHDGKYSLTTSTTDLPNGFKMPAGTFGFDDDTTPTAVGTYSVNFVGGQAELQKLLGKNYKVTYTPATDNFKVVSNVKTGKVNYVENGTTNVINSKNITGTIGGTAEVNAQDGVPAGWKIVDGQDIPDTVSVTKNGIDPITIKIEHNTIKVPATDPKTPEDKLPETPAKDYPDGDHYPEGVAESDLNKTVTRTINVTDPLTGKVTSTKQETKFTRDATVDLVTGGVTYDKWSQDGDNGWANAVEVPPMNGYTANVSITPNDQKYLDAFTPTADTPNVKIDITYTANAQSVTIKFVDTQDDNKQVGTAIIKSGKTGETITLGLTVPTNYKLAEGQTLPTSYKFTSAKDQVVVIKLVHEIDENYTDSKTITRTIVEKLPSGDKTITQDVTLTFKGTKDLVTGKVTGNWTTGKWDAFTPETVEGYTASPSSVSEQTVTADTKNVTIDITYTANKVPTPPTPEQGTHTIIYVDPDGKEVKKEVISGEDGTTVPFIPSYPAGYKPVEGQDIPDSVVINGGTTTIVVTADEPIVPPVKPTENTHTIIYVDPNGKEIKKEVISGKDGTTVSFTPSYPAGYKPVAGQTIPDSIIIDGGITRIVVVADKSANTDKPIVPPVKPTNKPAANNSATSTVTDNGEAAGWKVSREVVAAQRNKQHNNEKTLPQTGEKDNTLLAAIGSLFAGLGLFGLAGERRKKKNKD